MDTSKEESQKNIVDKQLNVGQDDDDAIKITNSQSEPKMQVSPDVTAPLIESELFCILSWKSKIRTLKYFIPLCVLCYLNQVHKVSFTTLILLFLLFKGLPSVLKSLRQGAEKAKEERKVRKDQDFVSEENFHFLIILGYQLLNRSVDRFKILIQFQQPLLNFAQSLTFLGLSALI